MIRKLEKNVLIFALLALIFQLFIRGGGGSSWESFYQYEKVACLSLLLSEFLFGTFVTLSSFAPFPPLLQNIPRTFLAIKLVVHHYG